MSDFDAGGPKRKLHDLTHFSFPYGKMGRLTTIARIPVLPGDGAELNIVGNIQLTKLRRGQVVDSKLDLAAFYIPHHHIYGDLWTDFIEEGLDETVTLPHETWTSTVASPAVRQGNVFAVSGLTGDRAKSPGFPKWIPQGYRNIWNEYYRPPAAIPRDERLYNTWNSTEIEYGWLCARMKSAVTALTLDGTDASDRVVQEETSGGIDLRKFMTQVARLKTEEEREFFNVRYRDIIRSFGGKTTIDRDNRPQLLTRKSQWLSGYNVEGTAMSNLGQHTGRVSSPFQLRLPRRFMPEHGAIWVMALVRFPVLNTEELHYLDNVHNPTYSEIAGDPDVIMHQPPFQPQVRDFYGSDSTTQCPGVMPYGQWYREHPSFTPTKWDDLQGFPIKTYVPTSDIKSWVMEQDGYYDSVFESQAIGDWYASIKVNAPFMRTYPSARDSLLTFS